MWTLKYRHLAAKLELTKLSRICRYSTVRSLSTLNYTTDIYNNSSIVSSIEFDKDQEYFAIAGVTKRIKIYDYNVVLKVSF